ncbi:phospholipase D-like domain-containing protein [Nocardioides bigeumensis]|uniref:Phospholipase D-like domain-containing protein n=1 Tax=Nocardioides bigeumensis TaxID=433657 RepID=A0ABN2Y3E8_9ACTN
MRRSLVLAVAAVVTLATVSSFVATADPSDDGTLLVAPAAAGEPGARAEKSEPVAATKATSSAPVLSGCQTDAAYEVCFSSPGLKNGPDPAVVRRFISIFGEAGEGDSLRIAMFRWDIPATTKAIVAAQKRGAHVELVADADLRTKVAGRAVLQKIEEGDPAPGNVVVCRGACLPWSGAGPAPDSQDVNHLKLLLADIDGRRSVITSSTNFEGRQYTQYNSLARVYDDAFYAYGSRYFARLKAQRWEVGGKRWSDADKTYAGPPRAMVYPRRGDLLVETLRSVTCAPGMRTVDIMIAVVQRADVRAQIGRLALGGCNLRIVTTRDTIENWLQKPFRLPDGRLVDIPDDRVRWLITHDKVYAIHAKVAGRERRLVITGTSNSTCGGLLYNDEMMLRLDGKWAFHAYSAHVRDAFGHARQASTPIIPVMKPCR